MKKDTLRKSFWKATLTTVTIMMVLCFTIKIVSKHLPHLDTSNFYVEDKPDRIQDEGGRIEMQQVGSEPYPYNWNRWQIPDQKEGRQAYNAQRLSYGLNVLMLVLIGMGLFHLMIGAACLFSITKGEEYGSSQERFASNNSFMRTWLLFYKP